jgi:hypothetical protein
MIYTAPCIMFWMRVYTLLGQVGVGWARKFERFFGPVKWHRVPFGAQKLVVRYFNLNSVQRVKLKGLVYLNL